MCITLFYYFFFFSSRRRHTRSTRDWSSDVCSSDLMKTSVRVLAIIAVGLAMLSTVACNKLQARDQLNKGVQSYKSAKYRSEERRVGKECRYRKSRNH